MQCEFCFARFRSEFLQCGVKGTMGAWVFIGYGPTGLNQFLLIVRVLQNSIIWAPLCMCMQTRSRILYMNWQIVLERSKSECSNPILGRPQTSQPLWTYSVYVDVTLAINPFDGSSSLSRLILLMKNLWHLYICLLLDFLEAVFLNFLYNSARSRHIIGLWS